MSHMQHWSLHRVVVAAEQTIHHTQILKGTCQRLHLLVVCELFPWCAAGVEFTVRRSQAGSGLVARQQELTQKTSPMIPAAANHLVWEHSAAPGNRTHQYLTAYTAHLQQNKSSSRWIDVIGPFFDVFISFSSWSKPQIKDLTAADADLHSSSPTSSTCQAAVMWPD